MSVVVTVVLLVGVRFTVVFHVVLGGIGTNNVEVNMELVVALLEEIVFYRARHAEVAITRLVKETLEGGFGVSCRKRNVGELHQNDQSAVVSRY